MESFPPPDISTRSAEIPSLHLRSLDMDFHLQPEALHNNALLETEQTTYGAHLLEASSELTPIAELQQGEVQIDSYDALAINTTLVLAGMRKTFGILKKVGNKSKRGAIAGAKVSKKVVVAGAKKAKKAAIKTKQVVTRESSIAYHTGRAHIKDSRSERAISASEKAEKARDQNADKLNGLLRSKNLYAFIGKLAWADNESDRDNIRQDAISLYGYVPKAKSSTERRKVKRMMNRASGAAVKQAYNDRVNKAYHSSTAQTVGAANRLANMSYRRETNQLAKSGAIDEGERRTRIDIQRANPASSKNSIQRSTEASAKRSRSAADRIINNANSPPVMQGERQRIIADITDDHLRVASKLVDSDRLSDEAYMHRQKAADKKALR